MTLPKEIRDRFHLQTGDRIDFVVEDDRVLMIPAKHTVRDLAALLPKPARALTIEEMDETVKEAVLQKHRRKR